MGILNFFRTLSTRAISNFFKMHSPPTFCFGKEFLLQKDTTTSNKNLVLIWFVEVVPESFFRITYKDTFVRSRFELVSHKAFDISLATPNLHERQLRALPFPYLVWSCLHSLRRCLVQNERSCLKSVSPKGHGEICLTHH